MAPKAAAQRSKSYRKRIKDDPEKYAQHLQSEKERYRRRRETGKLKSVSLLSSPGKHIYEKKRWKVNQQRKRAKDRENREIQNYLSMNSPPESPDVQAQDNQNRDVPCARNERGGKAEVKRIPSKPQSKVDAKKEIETEERSTMIFKSRKKSWKMPCKRLISIGKG